MSSLQNRRGRFLLDVQLKRAGDEPFLSCRVEPFLARKPFGVAAQRISSRYAIQQIEFAFPRQAAKRAVADLLLFLEKFTRLQMIAHQRDDLRAHIVPIERVDVQPVEKTQRRFDARFFVSAGAQASVDKFRRRRLTKVMTEGSEHYRDLFGVWKIVYQFARAIDNQPGM
ncbi:MAG: hypothetical protein E6L09_16200 [Verrucomicrobia bacterium]|nr:MAG: hypothetical protein E6L09_16200 [Verrucomicrobiota bacterium]